MVLQYAERLKRFLKIDYSKRHITISPPHLNTLIPQDLPLSKTVLEVPFPECAQLCCRGCLDVLNEYKGFPFVVILTLERAKSRLESAPVTKMMRVRRGFHDPFCWMHRAASFTMFLITPPKDTLMHMADTGSPALHWQRPGIVTWVPPGPSQALPLSPEDADQRLPQTE